MLSLRLLVAAALLVASAEGLLGTSSVTKEWTCGGDGAVVHVTSSGRISVAPNASTAPAEILACKFIIGQPGGSTTFTFTGVLPYERVHPFC